MGVDPIIFSGKAKELDDALSGVLAKLAADNADVFQNGAVIGALTPSVFVSMHGSKSQRYILLGMGVEDPKKGLESTSVMKIGSAVAMACYEEKIGSCNILLPGHKLNIGAYKDFASAFFFGL